jgi:CRISPR-associated endonuclease/helicase Cas3
MLTTNTIASAAKIAGLFHDFGKANVLFQKKLNPNKKNKNYEPYRHEWVSLRLFQTFVGECKTDKCWIDKLSCIENDNFKNCFKDGIDSGARDNHPIKNLPPFAQLIAWLVVSHHRLAIYPKWKNGFENQPELQNIDNWLNNFDANWNSYNCKDDNLKEFINDNWTFDKLPYQSAIWRDNAKSIAKNIQIHQTDDYLNQQLFTTHFARLCLILADHYYSSLTLSEIKNEWRDDNYNVWANTDRETKKYKQKLDEHLIGVAHNAGKIAQALPKLNNSLKSLKINNKISDDVTKEYKEKFGWQDKAKNLAKEIGKQTIENGFFGINMASTGKGKTLANAKIMATIGNEVGRVRFSVALGLRTLTLQTGKAYRTELDFKNDLAIMVGGIAVKELFVNEQQEEQEKSEKNTGSESENNSLNDFTMDYQGDLSEHSLSDWTKNKNNLEKLLQAPVLVSTIDHLIPATEGIRGDKHIPATLRLFTSDLILDEPDDFGLEDLPALCRLVNWAGMLGSRVLLSTATMPPALSFALFQAYQCGWGEYAKANFENWNGEITCAWFDEFNVKNASIKIMGKSNKEIGSFKNKHNEFVKKRITEILKNTKPKHLGKIVNIKGDESPLKNMANTIKISIKNLHDNHKINNQDKSISIGLVRMANIKPLVAIAKELLKSSTPKDTQIYYCVYHSKFPLALRSHIENKLDKILNRKNENTIWQQEKVKNSNIKNHIFVVLASPVAEVGRDHDYDWAIIEPSSMRSIIQIAGRVLRHRDKTPSKPNILLLNKNYRALKGEKPCFVYPGFETENDIEMNDNDLNNILEKNQYENITAIERITLPKKCHTQNNNLVGLEHKALAKKLFSQTKGAKLWWQKTPTWCGEMQRQQPFRKSKKDTPYYLCLKNEYENIYWMFKNEDVYPAKWSDDTGDKITNDEELEITDGNNFWFDIDVENIYKKLAKDFNIELNEVGKKFGEVRLLEYKDKPKYKFNPCLGVYEIIEDKENDE